MHNFVFGFVGETDEDRARSLDLIRRLHALDPERVFFTFRFFQPSWATEMGREAIARTPDFPETIEEMIHHRVRCGAEDEHAMGWLDEGVERRLKELVYYYLPMVTSRSNYASPARRWVYRALRRVAHWRLDAGVFGFGADRWLYDRALRGRLDCTYRA